MTVCRVLAASGVLFALGFGAGCGGNGNNPAGDETNDALYQQAKDFEKQGRNGEALSAFLKEIDRRGENGAPESHLEVGNLYLHWAGNPIEAYHHFYKYLELEPTGQRSEMVRGQKEAAQRAILQVLQIPASGQAPSADSADEVQQLRRQVRDLQAEVQTLRGNSDVPAVRSAPTINLADNTAAPDTSPSNNPIITPAPTPPAGDSPFTHSLSAAPSYGARPVPVIIPAAPERPAIAPSRPATTSRTANPAPGARRTHAVAPKDSLWGIARRYYGSGVTAAQVQAIYQANRDVMNSPNDLRAGMVLRIP